MNSALRVALMGKDKIIEAGQAISFLEAHGYSIFDSARLRDLFGGGEVDVEAVEGDAATEDEQTPHQPHQPSLEAP